MQFMGLSLRRKIGRTLKEEHGGLTILTLFLIVMMLLAGGAAIDFMRQEAMRARLQSTLDRAILASASLNQNMAAEDIVADYFAKSGLTGYTLHVDPVDGNNQYSRRVSARVSAEVDTMFLSFAGINQLLAPASGAAEESNATIEISLVLDISTSMNSRSSSGKTKIQELREAAQSFVDQIFDQSEGARTTISIVPYATQVNAGQALLDRYTYSRAHTYSYCLDFAAADFSTSFIDRNVMMKQAGHFDAVGGRTSSPSQWVCNIQNSTRILPISGNRAALKAYVGALQTLSYTGYTSTENGVKWGSTLLMPETQPVIASLTTAPASSGQRVESQFSDRPLPVFQGAMKIMVVMTDGDNTTQWFLRDAYRTGNSDVWKHKSNGTFVRSSSNQGSNYTRLTWPQVWTEMNAARYAQLAGGSAGNYYTTNSGATKDTYTRSACTAVKARQVRVYTIGFEIANNSNAHNLMRDCASSPAYYYPVDGAGIKTAFKSIANDIGKLRLTQ